MNRRVWFYFGLMLCSGLLVGRTSAQIAPGGPTIPLSIKTSSDPKAAHDVLAPFIKSQLAALVTDDPAAQRAARDRLLSDCTPDSSGTYFDVYAHELNAAAVELLRTNPLPPLRVRLNLAVVVEGVARVTQSSQLEPAVLALLNDPADPVALWGMKAAKHVIAAILQNNVLLSNTKLLGAILPCVKQHPNYGPLAADAYRALIPEIPGMKPDQLQQLLPPVFQPMLDVLSFRVSLYQTGIPENPEAETLFDSFFQRAKYDAATKAQQQQIIQQQVNLITLAGEQAPNATKLQLDQIKTAIRYAAQELAVISTLQNTVLQTLMSLDHATNDNGAQISPKVAPLFGVMKAVYPFLQSPPPISTPATAPATQGN